MQTVPPTAGPLAACPHCGARVAKPTGPVRFEYGVGVVGNQRCDRCGASWRYIWQEGKERRRGRWRLPTLIALLVVVIAVGAVAFASSRDPDHPSDWDARIRPIATRVEDLRGMPFEHPVDVHFVAASAFDRIVASDRAGSSDDDTDLDRTGALLRAMGLLGANVDLTSAVEAVRATETPAFYDPDTKLLYVRGTAPLSVDMRVALAHELTRALQDQAFGLSGLRRRAQGSNAGSVDAFDALVEGDANRIQTRYVEGLSRSERDEYALRSLAASRAAAARVKGIPAIVAAYFDAPDAFGAPVVSVLAAERGNASVDDAIKGPAPSTRMFLEPDAVERTAPIPTVPDLLPGEKALAGPPAGNHHFENYGFFLMLAAKLDLPTALRAADTFGTGSQIVYSRGARTCFRADVEGVTRTSSGYLEKVVRRWAATMPDAGVSFTANGVLLHSCDPGARAVTPPDARIQAAVRLAAARDDLAASLARQPLPTALAVCAARVLVQHPDFRAAILRGADLAHPTPRMVGESTDAGQTCRTNARAGLG